MGMYICIRHNHCQNITQCGFYVKFQARNDKGAEYGATGRRESHATIHVTIFHILSWLYSLQEGRNSVFCWSLRQQSFQNTKALAQTFV